MVSAGIVAIDDAGEAVLWLLVFDEPALVVLSEEQAATLSGISRTLARIPARASVGRFGIRSPRGMLVGNCWRKVGRRSVRHR
jgi:hypothetical protein